MRKQKVHSDRVVKNSIEIMRSHIRSADALVGGVEELEIASQNTMIDNYSKMELGAVDRMNSILDSSLDIGGGHTLGSFMKKKDFYEIKSIIAKSDAAPSQLDVIRQKIVLNLPEKLRDNGAKDIVLSKLDEFLSVYDSAINLSGERKGREAILADINDQIRRIREARSQLDAAIRAVERRYERPSETARQIKDAGRELAQVRFNAQLNEENARTCSEYLDFMMETDPRAYYYSALLGANPKLDDPEEIRQIRNRYLKNLEEGRRKSIDPGMIRALSKLSEMSRETFTYMAMFRGLESAERQRSSFKESQRASENKMHALEERGEIQNREMYAAFEKMEQYGARLVGMMKPLIADHNTILKIKRQYEAEKANA